MIRQSYVLWCGVALSVGAFASRAQQAFPEFRVAPGITVEGSWARAEAVVVGDVSNVVLKGYQQVSSLPAPLPDTVHEIRWCEAEFHAAAAIKGKMPIPVKKFVWGTIHQDCRLGAAFGGGDSGTPATRVWFLREEGEYLRPSVDAGGVYYVAFRADWKNVPASAAAKTFARFLLDPVALGLAPEQHYRLSEGFEVSRSILGDEEFVAELKAVAVRFPGTRLHDDIGRYLEFVSKGRQQPK